MTKIYKINYSSFNEKSNMAICSFNSNFLSSKSISNLNFKIIHQNNLTLKGPAGNGRSARRSIPEK